MAAAQLVLLHRLPDAAPTWTLEGLACARCEGGQMHLVRASEPCTCDEPQCVCLAEGYARCDTCGALGHVWPRDMRVQWVAEAG